MNKIGIVLLTVILVVGVVACSEGTLTPTPTQTVAPTLEATATPTPSPTPVPTPKPTPTPSPTPMPAIFEVSQLQMLPLEEGMYSLSAAIVNVGDESGTHTFEVSVDGEALNIQQFELDSVRFDNPEYDNGLVRVAMEAKESRTFTEFATTSARLFFIKYEDDFGYHTLKLDNEELEFRVDRPLEGYGDSITQPIHFPEGLAVFTLYHFGGSNFAVWLLDDRGEKIELLANEIGRYHGSTSVVLSAGSYRLDITADGAWDIVYSYSQ